MNKLITVLFLALILVGCADFPSTQHDSKHAQDREASDLKRYHYVKDSRTNLCFLSYASGGNAGLLTNVPCTEEVEKEIKKNAS